MFSVPKTYNNTCCRYIQHCMYRVWATRTSAPASLLLRNSLVSSRRRQPGSSQAMRLVRFPSFSSYHFSGRSNGAQCWLLSLYWLFETPWHADTLKGRGGRVKTYSKYCCYILKLINKLVNYFLNHALIFLNTAPKTRARSHQSFNWRTNPVVS